MSFVNENKHNSKTSFGKLVYEYGKTYSFDTIVIPTNIIEQLREKIISNTSAEKINK